jgi:hypothetical protein
MKKVFFVDWKKLEGEMKGKRIRKGSTVTVEYRDEEHFKITKV